MCVVAFIFMLSFAVLYWLVWKFTIVFVYTILITLVSSLQMFFTLLWFINYLYDFEILGYLNGIANRLLPCIVSDMSNFRKRYFKELLG